MTANILRFSLSPNHKLTSSFSHSNVNHQRRRINGHHFNPLIHQRRRSGQLLLRRNAVLAKAVEFKAPASGAEQQQQLKKDETIVLLDVSGMMCGACVTRVKSILSADDRVDSAVVNMLTETAAIKLKPEAGESFAAAEELAQRLTGCGFPTNKRSSGLGVDEKVKKWKEMVEKKEALLVESRNRVFFAWSLVALCCGTHATHILHSLGIHIGHGSVLDVLHNSYVKAGLAIGALLGPGRG
uniref:Copper-transporting ATPase PAA2, chloroplastic-like n=1 Tax=Nicotiana tabacum TaxID=4097 RepID=A0A1S4CTQ4_TOBAC|nr:PREDICTED: copper-transporting ATPase PAA2, chloroplastic-like [Nicotiana tabacum]